MTDLWHDLRYGVRMLRKNPGFAPVAVILAIRIVLACSFGAALFCAPGRAAPNADPQPPQFRLPAVVAPLHYTVSLTVAPDQDTFTGQVDIDLNFKEVTSVLWLNADKITVKDAALKVPKGDDAFSNPPALSETAGAGGMKTVKFAETKSLPSYLVAIAVGPMDIVDAGHAGANNTAIRIIVPRGRGAEAQYVARTTPDVVNLLEKYFGTPYPYEKLDEVAIPLALYAMEHPGLVTYGAGFFLSKPEETTLGRKRGVTSVMAHELSHQWFGDLVTTAWWDDIWLNEGFASWMANKIVNQYHPEWKMNLRELNGYQGAMGTDELVSSRKVRQPILSDDDIANAFDNITYNKGSALLNMFESYIGPEKFQE